MTLSHCQEANHALHCFERAE
jgi:anaphase-promoting complex subunit 3